MKYKFHLSNFFIGFLLHQYLPQTTKASIRNKCPSGGPISALSDKSHSLEFPPARDLQLWINYIFNYNKWGEEKQVPQCVRKEALSEVQIACHHLASDLGNYRFPFILAIVVLFVFFSLSLHSRHLNFSKSVKLNTLRSFTELKILHHKTLFM
jgi:hypothetical protein